MHVIGSVCVTHIVNGSACHDACMSLGVRVTNIVNASACVLAVHVNGRACHYECMSVGVRVRHIVNGSAYILGVHVIGSACHTHDHWEGVSHAYMGALSASGALTLCMWPTCTDVLTN